MVSEPLGCCGRLVVVNFLLAKRDAWVVFACNELFRGGKVPCTGSALRETEVGGESS